MSVIPKIPRASGGLCPLGPLPGLYPGPAGDLKRPPDPSPTHAPLTTNPGSAPVYVYVLLTEDTYTRAKLFYIQLNRKTYVGLT